MPWIVLGVVFLLTGIGAALLILRVVRRSRPDSLTELPPRPPPSVAEEAYEWLGRR